MNWNLSCKKRRLKGSNYCKQEILTLLAGLSSWAGQAEPQQGRTAAAHLRGWLAPCSPQPPASEHHTGVGRKVSDVLCTLGSPTISRAQPAGPPSSKSETFV